MNLCSKMMIVLAAAALTATPARAQVTYPYRLGVPRTPPLQLEVVQVAPDGVVRVQYDPAADAPNLSEGLYLLAPGGESGPQPQGFEISRVEVREVLDGGKAVILAGEQTRAGLKPGTRVSIFRPPGATTARLKALPERLKVTFGAPDVPGSKPGSDPGAIRKSTNNLKQIGLAMHNYHDATGSFPPAVVIGPDGKPWHSWRVLILPYLEQVSLYNQYDFSQPWDSPKNQAVLDKIPDVYRDPLQAQAAGPYTNYAALVGNRAAFLSEGVRMTDPRTVPMGRGPGRTSVVDFIDGTSLTVMAAIVDSERKIPWTKPEDVNVDEGLEIGKPNGLAAPVRTTAANGNELRQTLALFCDGSVRSIRADLPQPVLNALSTRNGREVISTGDLGSNGAGGPGGGRVPVLEIYQEGGKTLGRILEVAEDATRTVHPPESRPVPPPAAPVRRPS